MTPRRRQGRRRWRTIDIVGRAVEEPLRQIAGNAGQEGAVVVGKVREGGDSFGFNAATEAYEDLVAAGVIDPAKVTRTALQNAASISARPSIFVVSIPSPSNWGSRAPSGR